MAAYVKVANTDDLQAGQAKLISVADRQVALFNVGGTCYAIDDTCSHVGGSLSEGALDNDVVTCPWHGARFCVYAMDECKGRRPKSTSAHIPCESRTAVSR